MSDTPPLPPPGSSPGAGSPMIPLMLPEGARDIARGLKWLAGSYAEHGMAREAARSERDSAWWLTYAATLAITAKEPPR